MVGEKMSEEEWKEMATNHRLAEIIGQIEIINIKLKALNDRLKRIEGKDDDA